MLKIIESESVPINLWREDGIPGERRILLVSTDLQARVRVERAAEPLGLVVVARRPDQDAALDPPPVVVILDLDQIRDVDGWMRAAGPGTPRVLGFFSHVQTEAGAAAAAAGVEVHRRGRFWTRLEELLNDVV